MGKKNKNRKSAPESRTELPPTPEVLDRIELDGEVVDVLPQTMFKVAVQGGSIVLATLAGKLRMNKIRILLGDRVRVEVSPYDMARGRVTIRY